MNRKVRIFTNDGKVHEGVIVGVNNRHVFLRTECAKNQVHTSAFYNPYAANQILTLSLFTLLAIALI